MSSSSQATPSHEHNFLDQSIKTRFEVITKIGSGAYGHVWKVRQRSSSLIFAIKKVFLAFQNQIDAQRVYREIALLGKLKHNNVVALKGIIPAQNGQDIYLLFQHLESDVFKAVKNRVLDQMHKKYIVYQLACGLKYLHSAGVLHRDLKPSNVLINAQCQVKICDFGLSRTLESAFFNQPIMTEFIATRWYRAPEVLLGSRSYGTKSDMWSLGCLIYELYSRRTLLPGENTIDQISKIVEFKGKPTANEIKTFKTEKGDEILSYFNVERRDRRFYYDDLEIEEIKPILDQLLQYDPDKRWSAEQLLDCDFLEEFRDRSCEVTALQVVHLGLNDNRKYKVDRYKDELLKLGECGARGFKLPSSKRLYFSNRSQNNSSKLSLYSHDIGQKNKHNLSTSKMNTTLRQKFKETKDKLRTAGSPQMRDHAGKGTGFASLHITKNNSIQMNTNQKTASLHTKRSIYLNSSKPKQLTKEVSVSSMNNKQVIKRKPSPNRSVHKQSTSGHKAAIPVKRQMSHHQTNKENYEDRLRTLKKTQIKHYRNDIQTQNF